jgi:microcompartment protein CcmK/EutM
VVVDPLGAGLHEQVIICSDGSWARTYLNDPRSPCRWWVMALVDEVPERSVVA